MHTIQRILQRQQVVHVSAEDSVFATAERMAERGIGAIAVVAGDRLIGIFSERDLMTRVVVPGHDPHQVAVGEVMTRDPVTSRIGETRERALGKMKRRGCRHLPVVAEGRLIGMLSMRDLLRDEIAEQEQEIRSLKAYLYQQPLA